MKDLGTLTVDWDTDELYVVTDLLEVDGLPIIQTLLSTEHPPRTVRVFATAAGLSSIENGKMCVEKVKK